MPIPIRDDKNNLKNIFVKLHNLYYGTSVTIQWPLDQWSPAFLGWWPIHPNLPFKVANPGLAQSVLVPRQTSSTTQARSAGQVRARGIAGAVIRRYLPQHILCSFPAAAPQTVLWLAEGWGTRQRPTWTCMAWSPLLPTHPQMKTAERGPKWRQSSTLREKGKKAQWAQEPQCFSSLSALHWSKHPCAGC